MNISISMLKNMFGWKSRLTVNKFLFLTSRIETGVFQELFITSYFLNKYFCCNIEAQKTHYSKEMNLQRRGLEEIASQTHASSVNFTLN